MSQKKVKVGSLTLGENFIPVQSMATVKTEKVDEVLSQINRLERAGCDIARVSVLDEADAKAIGEIKKGTGLPIVADIHFSARLAVLAAEAGADKLRLNPGNIGGEGNVARVADCLKERRIPVRVGSNTGSIEPKFLQKYGVSAKALVESALSRVAQLEKHGVEDIVVSVKASSVPLTVEAYTLLSKSCPYPLHIGVTEAGGGESGLVKSSVGIGALLLNGIGDTLRVSLTDDPVKEVIAGHEILRAVGIEKDFVEVISCPTCGRCEYNCMELAKAVSERVSGVKKAKKVAVMGCVVNGPGEAKECDLGIAGGREYCVIFEKDKMERVRPCDAEKEFFARLDKLLNE